MEVWLGEKPLGGARIAVPRPDVNHKADLPVGVAPGFELTASLQSWPGADGETALRAVATSFAGARPELGPLPLKILTRPARGQPWRQPSARRTPFPDPGSEP